MELALLDSFSNLLSSQRSLARKDNMTDGRNIGSVPQILSSFPLCPVVDV